MSRRRFENLDPERQKRLFESAAEEFGDKGYDAASLNRIIERSGMSKSSLYYYFDDKADLFTTLLDRSLAFVFREIGGFDPDALTAETYWSAFEDLYRRAIGVVNKNAWLVKFGRIFYRLGGNPKVGPPTGRTFEAARRWVGVVLARGQALGVVRTDLPETLLIDCTMGLLEALDRWGVAHWEDIDHETRLRMGHVQIDLLRRLLAP
jgi:AcrR family transcriptional regulator